MHYIHDINPILISLGPFTIRWYGVMYLVGFVAGYKLLTHRHKRGLLALTPEQSGNLITWLIVGMMLGARLIYVLVYNPMHYFAHPGEIIAIWEGGLSFHGAALGFIAATYLYGRKLGVPFFHIMDSVVLGSALGITFGRLGNFINGELAGRITDVPWAVIFPAYGPEPRHPSQIYQSLTEGLLLFLILLGVQKWEQKKGYAPLRHAGKKHWSRIGVLSCWFLILYGVFRFSTEFFRQPDSQLGFFFGWVSMGQILCSLMIIAGALLLYRAVKHPQTFTY